MLCLIIDIWHCFKSEVVFFPVFLTMGVQNLFFQGCFLPVNTMVKNGYHLKPSNPVQTFWNFPQNTAVILPCSLQNFKTIRLFQCRDGWDFMKFESKMCFGQISSIAEHPCLLYINRPSAGMMFPMTYLSKTCPCLLREYNLCCNFRIWYKKKKMVWHVNYILVQNLSPRWENKMMFAVFIMPQQWDGGGV